MTNATARTTGRSNVQLAALVVGIAFLLVGVLGFIPGVTTNYEQMMFAGHESTAMLLGVFQVSIFHNIVHLLFGVVGVALARSAPGARNYLIWGGAVYALFWLYGLFIGHDTAANFVPFNDADDWLHFVLAVAMIGLGLFLPRTDRGSRRSTSSGRTT
jgi:arginine exporter protein ArgO